MAPVIVGRHEFKPAALDVGYTALDTFYHVQQVKTPIKLYIYHDESHVSVVINSGVKIRIKYNNIAFINIQENHLIIAYNYTPFVEKVFKSEENSQLAETLNTNLHYGSALHFHINKLTRKMEQMLDLYSIKCCHHKFTFCPNNLPAEFDNNRYAALCVRKLGYPGLFLRQHLIRTNALGLSDEARFNIYYQVITDRHLTTLEVADYPELEMDNENYVKYRSMTVTPTGTFFHPPTSKHSNFALRNVDIDKIISVTFVDNDGQQIWDDQYIQSSIEKFCRDGFDCCLRHYNYFLASSSKFREHSHYFYEGTKDEILNLWKSMGTYERALPAKIGARVGLNSSSVRIGIHLDRFKVVPDIKSRDLKYNFTDGCGLITRAFAVKLQRKFGLKFLPSAFQIRFPGFKGVLFNCAEHLSFYDPLDDDDEDDDFDVKFTREMRKFYGTTKNATLDVIKSSSPVPLNLNKNLIEVLCQNAAKHEDAVKKRVQKKLGQMAQDSVMDLTEKCVDPLKFRETLEQLPKYMDYNKMESYSQSELLSEPFVRDLVAANSVFSMKRLHEKQQIPIHSPMGRNMIGVPDFHGFLEPNQVYVRYSETLDPKCKEKIVHKGPVAVTRSPLYHLGGIQFVEAVDVPYYTEQGVCDVIVFPIKGKMPIQESIAKGDLDGDEYAVFWDPDLMMPSSLKVPTYTPPKVNKKQEIGLDKLQDAYPKFIAEYMSKQPVGVYSNCHSHLAEIFGYDHPDVIKAANKNEDSLVYFKSGIPPGNLVAEERAVYYQEHMRKEHVPSYRIDNVLSNNHTLFRQFHDDINDVFKTDTTAMYLDHQIDVEGWESCLEEASLLHEQFVNQIKRILAPYGSLSMGEVFSGRISEFRNYRYNKDDDTMTSTRGLIQAKINLLMATFREDFLDSFYAEWRQDMLDKDEDIFSYYLPITTPEIQQFAVACYKVAYTNNECLAFPWLLWDVIDRIRRNYDLRRSFFELNVFDGAIPRQNNTLQLETVVFHNFEKTKNHSALRREIFGIIYHLKKHTKMNVPAEYFKTLLISFSKNHVEDAFDSFDNLAEVPLQFTLQLVTKFIKTMAFNQNVDRNVREICRTLYLQMAFQKNPQIFKNEFAVPEVPRLQRFTLKIPLKLTDALLQCWTEKTGCQITYKQLATELLKKYKNKDVSKRYLQVYVLLAYGSSQNMKQLRNVLISKFDKWESWQFDSWHSRVIVSYNKFNRLKKAEPAPVNHVNLQPKKLFPQFFVHFD